MECTRIVSRPLGLANQKGAAKHQEGSALLGLLLEAVGEGVAGRGERAEDDVSGAGRRCPELSVGSVQVVEDAQHAVALVELEVVVVVRLGRHHERQVVAAVVVQRHHDDAAQPQPRRGQVRIQQDDADRRRQQVGHQVFQRVAVNGHERHRRRPLVVLLVDVLVDHRMVEHPIRWCFFHKITFDQQNYDEHYWPKWTIGNKWGLIFFSGLWTVDRLRNFFFQKLCKLLS